MHHNLYPNLLSPIKIGNVVFKNRLFSSPSMPHYHQEAGPFTGENLIAHFAGRAKGGAALVTCSGTKIYPKSDITDHFIQLDINDPQVHVFLSQMVDAIHLYGAKASIILDSPKREGYDVVAGIPSHSVAGDDSKSSLGKEMPAEWIYDIAEEYADQCEIFKHCGFDMVFFHGSYQQFLPARFLTPQLNKRTDELGGPIENRAKFALAVLRAIKKRCGRDFLIEMSLTPEEPNGLTMEDAAKFIDMAKDDLDIVQIRYNHIDTSVPMGFHDDPTPWRDMARRFHAMIKKTGVVLDTVGGYLDPDVCETVIREDEADVVSLARGWMSNPDYGTLLYEERPDDIIPCIRCNKCHVSSHADPYLSVCSVNPFLGYEARLDWMIRPAERKKKVAVVGGGPGGMKTALALEQRGHSVTLYEATDKLGGLLKHADHCKFKWPIRQYKDWLIYQLGKHSVNIRLNTFATPELLRKEGYDEVIVAVGSSPIIPKGIPGSESEIVMTAIDSYYNEDKVGGNVVIIGGGEIGAETGLHFAQKGRNVTVIEMQGKLAADATPIHYRSLFEMEWEKEENFHYVLNATCSGIDPDGVRYVDADGAERKLPADTVILSVGMRPNSDEALALYDPSYVVRMVGDCVKGGNIQKVTRGAVGAAALV